LENNILNNYRTSGIKLTRTLMEALAAFLFLLLFQSCFTGIESTPKITYKDVKKEQIQESAEQVYAKEFQTVDFNQWQPGRRFLVADEKGKLYYSPCVGRYNEAALGDTLVYCGVSEVPSIVGGKAAEIVFVNSKNYGDTLIYRPGISADQLAERSSVMLPFVVDIDMVELARRKLLGKELYTRTDRWISESGSTIKGRKFLKVKITAVDSYTETYPYLISFSSAEGGDEKGSLMMSTTSVDDTPALRGFQDLFYLSNPRDNYPLITDHNWELIREGQVEEGMTTQEASLSLGTPREVDRRHDQSFAYERWSYSEGVYLIFEDGLLVKFNR
jgi:hypothetical protein